MTTATPPDSPAARPAPVAGAARAALLVTVGAGLLTVAAAALAGGGPAASGAALGAAMVCLFFGFGTLAVGLVASVVPAASLLVALLTYSLQVLLMGAVLVGLTRSGALDRTVDAGWLAGTLIGGTLLWSAAQIVAHNRSREPLYRPAPGRPEANAR
jgi:ATP synthase protein I